MAKNIRLTNEALKAGQKEYERITGTKVNSVSANTPRASAPATSASTVPVVSRIDPERYGITANQAAQIDSYRTRIGDYDWRSKYVYDPFDDEDMMRQQAGYLPKSLMKKYDMSDPVDVALYRNGLPARNIIQSITTNAEKKAKKDAEDAADEALIKETDLDPFFGNLGSGIAATPVGTAFEKDPNGYLPVPDDTKKAEVKKPVFLNALGQPVYSEKVTEPEMPEEFTNPLTGVTSKTGQTQKKADPNSLQNQNAFGLLGAGLMAYADYSDRSVEAAKEAARQDEMVWTNPLTGEKTTVDNSEAAARLREEDRIRQLAETRKNMGEQLERQYYLQTVPSRADYEEQAAQGAKMELPAAQRQGQLGVLDTTENPYLNTAKVNAGINSLASYMTEDERKTYDYLRAAEGEEAAQRYWNFIEEELNSRWTQKEQERAAEFARENPVEASLLSTSTGLASGLKGLTYVIGQQAKGEQINPENSAFSPGLTKQTIRSTVSENMSDAGKFFYNTAMSFADNLIGMATTGSANLGFIAADAFQSGVQSAKAAGASDNQAVGMGVISGLAEYLTEKAGFDRVMDSFGNAAAGNGLKRFFTTAIQSAVPEALEESASEVANTLADLIIMKDKGEVLSAYNAYLKDGMTPDQAQRATTQSVFNQVLLSAAGGALSGAVMAGGAAMVGGLGNRTAQQELSAPAGVQTDVSVPVNAQTDYQDSIPAVQTQTGTQEPILTPETYVQTDAAVLGANDTVNQFDIESRYRGLEKELSQMRFSPHGISDTVRKTMGRTIRLNGTTDISAKYAELSQRFPSLFPQNVTGVENQLGQISRVLRQLRSGETAVNPNDVRVFLEETRNQINEIQNRENARRRLQSLQDIYSRMPDKTSKRAVKLANEIQALSAQAGTQTQTENESQLQALQAEYDAYRNYIKSNADQNPLVTGEADVSADDINALNARLDEIDELLDSGVDDLRLEMERAYIMEMLDGSRPIDTSILPQYAAEEAVAETAEKPAETPETDFIVSGGGLVKKTEPTAFSPGKDPIVNGGVQTNKRWTQAAAESGVKAPGMLPRVENRQAVPNSFDGGETRVSDTARNFNESSAVTDENYAAFQEAAPELFSYKVKSMDETLQEGVKKRGEYKNYKECADAFIRESQQRASGAKDDASRKYGIGSMSDSDAAMAFMAFIEAERAGDTETANAIAKEITAINIAAGRWINAQKLLKTMTPEGRFGSWERVAQSISTKYSTQKNQVDIKISDAVKTQFIEADRAFYENQTAETAEAYDKAKRAVEKEIASQIPASFLDKVDELRYLAMLGNPKTILRNKLGNTAMRGVQSIRDVAAALIEDVADAAFGLDTRTKTLRGVFSEEGAAARRFAKEDAQSLETTAILQGNETKYSAQNSIEQARHALSDNNRVGRGINWLSDKVSERLENDDLKALRKSYASALSSYMRANNLTPADMTGKTLSEAREYAVQQAQRATFREKSVFANALNQFERNSKAARVLLGGTVPFTKTPINVAKQSIRYSPAGFITTVYSNVKAKASGEFTGAKLISDLSENITGSALALAGFFLAKSGLLKASGSDDKDRNYYDEATGYQNYSVTIPGVGSYSVDWLAPAAVPLFLGAEVWDILNGTGEPGESPDSSTIDNVVNALANITEPIVEMSMLDGLNSAVESLKEGDIGGVAGSFVANTMTGYATQMVPTVFGQAARTIDSKRRDPSYTTKSGFSGGVEKTFNKVLNKVPGASMLLPEYVDSNGQVEYNYTDAASFAGNALEQWISPGYWSAADTSPLTAERKRLNDTTGSNSVLPSYIGREVKYDGKTYNMTAEERNQYKTTYGVIQSELGQSVIQSRAYRSIADNDAMKSYILKSLGSYAKAVANAEFLQGRGVPIDFEDKNKSSEYRSAAAVNQASQKYGISPGDFFAVKYVYNQAKGKAKDPITGRTIENSQKSIAAEYMKRIGFTDAQISYMTKSILK